MNTFLDQCRACRSDRILKPLGVDLSNDNEGYQHAAEAIQENEEHI